MEEIKEQWAIVELMGHAQTAGRIEMGALLRVDVPIGDSYRTEYYGMAAIYSVRMVSEEIARAYSHSPIALPYDAPVVTKERHQKLLEEYSKLQDKLSSTNLIDKENDDDDEKDYSRDEYVVDEDIPEGLI